MGKSTKSFLGSLMSMGGVLLIAYWFIASYMAEEEVNLLLGAAYTFTGLILTLFGWHIWRSNREATEKGTGWVCGECGNKVYKNDKFCSKCGSEFK
jgi:Na+-driven multidrug efflux pump